MLFRFLKNTFPWLITLGALYYAFKDIEWAELLKYVREARPSYLWIAFGTTIVSYLLRSRRWQFLFPRTRLPFADSAKVLFLGFFMNNVLPARAGELVRAHAGGRVTGTKRTFVLATIFNERLADGLAISCLFGIFAIRLGDGGILRNFSYVAFAFGLAAIIVVALLGNRRLLYRVLEFLNSRSSHAASQYALNRVQVFIDGLSPLLDRSRLPYIIVSSLVIWLVELAVYISISHAYSCELSLPQDVLFLVSVNFSSLIPSAPGGIGVIEAVTLIVLTSLGVDRERALAMIVTQHIIQYLVVGIPGAWALMNLRGQIAGFRSQECEPGADSTSGI